MVRRPPEAPGFWIVSKTKVLGRRHVHITAFSRNLIATRPQFADLTEHGTHRTLNASQRWAVELIL